MDSARALATDPVLFTPPSRRFASFIRIDPPSPPVSEVAFQGERGAYSEEAARRLYPGTTAYAPLASFEDVFAAVEAGRADAAVVPVENTTTGSVYQVEDLMYARPTVWAVAESVLPIEHALILRPGAAESGVTTVYSHPQALAQCERFVRSRGWKAVPVWDTAGAVRWLRDEGPADAAVLASPFAAGLYGMRVAHERVQDEPGNMTRFLALERRDVAPSRADADTTSIAFATAHKPGALHEALGILADRALNLVRLHSRPVRGRPWEYAFFADVASPPGTPELTDALHELVRRCRDVRVLGAYRRSRGV